MVGTKDKDAEMKNSRTLLTRRWAAPGLALLLVALLVAVGGFLLPSKVQATQGAEVEEGIYRITCFESGKALDVNDAVMANGTNVQLYSSTGTFAQYWRVERVGEHYTVSNSFSGYALDVYAGGTTSGTNVQIYQPNGTSAQLWDFVSNDDGSYSIVSAASGLALDVAAGNMSNGANVQVWEANGTSAQRWGLERVSRSVDDGVYAISTALDADLALGVSEASSSDGARVTLTATGDLLAQKWSVTYNEKTGFYSIVNVNSMKALDVPAASGSQGVVLQQYSANGTIAQAWSILPTEGGYKVLSAVSGLAADVPAASASAGVAVQTWEDNGTKAQAWSLEPTTLSLDGVYQLSSASNTSFVLDVYAASTAENGRVQVWSKNGTLAQKWQLVELDGGDYLIRNVNSGRYLYEASDGLRSTYAPETSAHWKVVLNGLGFVLENASSGKVLGITQTLGEGALVGTSDSTGAGAQAWRLETTSLLDEGCYVLVNRAGTSQALDVPAASASSGVALQTTAANGTAAQKWDVTSKGDGWYVITNAASGLALDVRNGLAESGNVVQQYESNGTKAQLWKFTVAPTGGIAVVSALGDLALSAASATPTSGTPVQVLAPASGVACGWTFEATSYVPDQGPSIENPPAGGEVVSGDVADVWGDTSYVAAMRSRAARAGSSTGWITVVDKSLDRATVFCKNGDDWVLAGSMNVLTSGNTFTGTHQVYIRARGYWKEPNCYDVNDWYVGFVEDWWSSPSSSNMRYEEGRGYDEGQGFHYGFRGTGCICIPDYSQAKWLYDRMAVGSTVLIF